MTSPSQPEPFESTQAGREAQERSTVWFGEAVEHELGTGQAADVQDTPTATFVPAAAATGATATTTAITTGAGSRRPTGPNPAAILLGLLCLAVAAMTISREVSGVIVHLAMVGPLVIVVAGLVFVLAGLSGLLRRR